MSSIYQEVILHHYRNPFGKGLREHDSLASRINPTCGDEATVAVSLDGDRISDISYEVQGCAISQASVSVLAEQATGLKVGDAVELADAFTNMLLHRCEADEDLLGDGAAFAGVADYPARIQCALVGWSAFREAIA